MSRAERLLELLQNLRRRKYAAKGEALARELGISLRTLYRDIAALQTQGAPIEGEAGVGYILRPGYTLPPLMFTPEEIEVMVLGAQWVAERGDERLCREAGNALAKIRAVVPSALRRELESCALLIPQKRRIPVDGHFLVAVRRAIRSDTKITITYRDLKDRVTRRGIWPFALAFYDEVQIVIAWCERRQGFRNFRADRVEEWVDTRTPYPRNHKDLLREWRETEKIPSHGIDL